MRRQTSALTTHSLAARNCHRILIDQIIGVCVCEREMYSYGTMGSSCPLPAEGIDNQEVAHHAGDADSQDDGPYSVMGVVRYIHSGEGVTRGLVHRGHLQVNQNNCI